MSEPLYCGADGCTLHDYDVTPIFCKYAWHQEQAERTHEADERRANSLFERIDKLVDTVGYALEQLADTRYTKNGDYVANRESQTTPSAPKRNREGGISI